MTSLGMVLEQYPSDVIIHITDPRTGVQRHLKWPPTIAEIIDACDKRMQEKAAQKRFENWGRNEVPLLEAPRDDRPTPDELKAKYGENWGLDQAPRRAPKKAPDWESVIAEYRANPERLYRLMRAADDYADDRGEALP